MKRKCFLALISVLFSGLAVFGQAGIEWIGGEVYDFGAFEEEGGLRTAVFRYCNVGSEPLVVTGARANCGCTTPRYSLEALAPGDTATLVVSYNPAGRPGRFSKKVYVDTNTEPVRSVLTICGTVVGAPASVAGRYPVEAGRLRLAHGSVLLGVLEKGHVKSVFEGGYNASTDTLRPVVSGAPRWLDVKPVPAVVAPGEQVQFNYFVHGDRVETYDLVTDTVVVSDGSGTELRVPVVLTVKEDFGDVSDAKLARAPRVKVGPAVPEVVDEGGTVMFSIGNSGKEPLRIRRVYSMTPGVEVEAVDGAVVKSGKERRVKVRVNADGNGVGARRVVVKVITNDPTEPVSMVRFGVRP